MKRKDSPPVTPEMAALIKYLVKRIGLYQHQVAALLKINQGRVSEVITGKRYPNIEPNQGSFSF
jgi:predicted transcriptional regulator